MVRSVPLLPQVGSRPAVAAHDRDGYADVFRSHHDAMLRLAYLLCGDPHRAEEAVAEAFAKVWPHWRRGRTWRTSALAPFGHQQDAPATWTGHEVVIFSGEPTISDPEPAECCDAAPLGASFLP